MSENGQTTPGPGGKVDSMTEQEICYRALLTRDRRFDGRFFTAVLTTGVYCRPICPARTPKASNVRFYPNAWSAEAAGFRPCLRCRPETAPGSPAWLGSEDTVRRAMRLVEEGLLETEGLGTLARRMGVGERHLRRLFRDHLGAAPVEVAQTRRVQLSKQLLDETEIPLAQVAFAAGFSSVRRFNAVFLKTYGRPPSTFRRQSGQTGVITMSLCYRPPFSWSGLSAYLRPRLFAGCELIDDHGYRRLLPAPDGPAEISVRPGKDALRLTVPASLLSQVIGLRARARRLFDLDADPLRISTQLRELDPPLEALRLPGAWEPFESAVRVILGQQVSVQGAATLARRVIERFGEEVAEGPLSHLFPLPQVLAEAPLEEVGMPRSRAQTLRELSRAIATGFELKARIGLTEDLLEIPGVGPWTAAMIALRLGEPDAFPAGDLVLRQRTGCSTSRALEQWAERWRPFRAYAAMVLWQGGATR